MSLDEQGIVDPLLFSMFVAETMFVAERKSTQERGLLTTQLAPLQLRIEQE